MIQNALIQQQHQHQQQSGYQIGLGQRHSESESIQQQQQNMNTTSQNIRAGDQEAAIALLTNLANAAHNNQRNL
jgi:hypothetical protein